MARWAGRAAVFLVGAMVALACIPRAVCCEPAPGVPDPRAPGFSRYEVNGAAVYFRRSPGAPKGAISGVMMAGIGDQRPDEAHCAHMAEHMVICFPGKSGVSVMSAAGGFTSGVQFNVQGGTSLDSTGYIISVANDDIPRMVALFLDSLFHTDLHAGDDYLAEIKRSRRELDFMTTDAKSALANRLRVNAFRGTPYEERLFETPLETVSAGKIRGFMEREYSPRRLTLAIVGDVDEASVLQAVRNGLEGLDPGPEPARRNVTLTQVEPEVLELPGLEKPSIGLAVGIDGVEPADLLYLAKLFNVLAHRLYLKGNVAGLRPEPGLYQSLYVQGASIWTLGYSPPSAVGDMSFVRESIPHVTGAVSEVLASLAKEGVTAGETSDWSLPGALDTQKAAQQQFTPACLEAMAVTGAVTRDLGPEGAGPPGATPADEEALAKLNTVARKYLLDVKLTVVVTAERPATVKTWTIAALTLSAILVLGFLAFRISHRTEV